MKTIKLTRGYLAKIDDEDYEFLSKYKWQVNINRNGMYAITSVYHKETKKQSLLHMHRLILRLKAGDGKMVDHKDRDGLNNQKCNLRICNRSENGRNRKKISGASSKYYGVSMISRSKNGLLK